jgi:hypothetical protein
MRHLEGMPASNKLLSLLCLPTLVGCAGEPHDTTEVDTSLQEPVDDPELVAMPATGERTSEEQVDLDQLAALEVFAVGGLLARYPAGAMNCYGVCPQFEDEVAQANELAGERLAALIEQVDAALESDAAVEPDACEQAAIEANLAALRALEVVEVGEFLAVVPQNNPHCYNVPCPEDEQVAQQATCERATKLAGIVDGL